MSMVLGNAWWRFRLTCIVVGSCAALPPGPVLAQDDKQLWAEKAIESFEMYCFRTSAKYQKIESMAIAMKLKPTPKELLAVGMGPNSKDGKSYFVKWDKEKGMYLLLGFSRPDACSIYAQGVSYEYVKKRLHQHYKLVLAFRDDVGLQVSEMYVPGGIRGDKKEAAELGFVLVTYPKPDVASFGFSLGYLPPETVKVQFAK